MSLYLRLAWRNVWRHKRRTIIVVLSIGLTMMMMIFYDGLIGGFNQAIYGNAIKVMGGNIQVHAKGYHEQTGQMPLLAMDNEESIVKAALALPQVAASSRRINTGGMATNREGAFGVSIIGIEPEEELPLSLQAEHVIAGRYLQPGDLDAVFIGKGLADAMNISVGDRFTLTGRAMHNQMRQRSMTVLGIYDIGLPQFEKSMVYISLGEAQDLYGLSGQSTEVVIVLKQIGEEDAVMKAMQPALNGAEINSWVTRYPELSMALATKGAAMNVFSVVMLLIAGIGILNLLLMAVYERTREIGVLGAFGMKPGQVSLLFVLEGALMGLVGLVCGVSLGLLINVLFSRVGMDFSQFSNLTEYMALISGKVYTTLGLDKLLARGLTVLVITILASLYPAREAAQYEPAKALHYV
jgi:putative ABC transport system permease protein